ncbi:MAG: hypothetical protein ACK5XN_30170 [Bacteroidota bacterium]|jgi:hypothetical protein
MTFEEFQATKKREPLADFESRTNTDLHDPHGGHVLSYGPGNMLYIIDYTEVPFGNYYLLIERSEWIDADLSKLERILYDWAVGETILDTGTSSGEAG